MAHLLRHQSGLPDHPHLPEFQETARARIAAGENAFTSEKLLGFVVGREAVFGAGTGWAYSDTGHILLGLVIGDVTERPYHDLVREMFLDPLGLGDTIPSERRRACLHLPRSCPPGSCVVRG